MQSNTGSTKIMGKVINSRDIPTAFLPADTIFVDKGSPYANPFVIGVHGERDEVCDRYDLMIANETDFLKDMEYLRGKNLVTFHAPHRCHAHTLVKLAAMDLDQRMEWADNVNAHFIDKTWVPARLMALAA